MDQRQHQQQQGGQGAQKRYACAQCPREFTRRFDLKRHVESGACRAAQPGQEYRCRDCNFVITGRPDNFRRHLRTCSLRGAEALLALKVLERPVVVVGARKPSEVIDLTDVDGEERDDDVVFELAPDPRDEPAQAGVVAQPVAFDLLDDTPRSQLVGATSQQQQVCPEHGVLFDSMGDYQRHLQEVEHTPGPPSW